jgi:acyl-CoA synthetase (AMP-forming)/AMP-acid ligase II
VAELSADPSAEEWEQTTIPRMVRRAAALWPNQNALEDDTRTLTFAELAAAAEGAARGFIAAGIEPGDRVGIWAPNIWEWVIAAIGLQSAGASLAALNFRYKPGEAAAVMRRIEVRVLVTLGEWEGETPADDIAGEDVPSLEQIVVLRGESKTGTSFADFLAAGAAVSQETARERADEVAPDDIADLIFTSGTTGQPKAVMCSHGQNLRTFDAWSRGVTLTAGDRMIVIPPFSHSFGSKAGWLACFIRGATVLPHRDATPPALLERIQKDRVSVWPGAPSMYQTVLAHPGWQQFDLSSLRVAITGGAAVPVELVHQLRREVGFEVLLTAYGLTETTGCVSMSLPDDDPETIATASGRAMPGVEVLCVDPEGKEVPRGQPGEIVVRGYNLMQGYWGDAEQTAATIDGDGWLHTGDIGVMDERGYLRITDRIKDMFIMNGFNVYPAEVENQMFAHEAIAQVAVVGVPNERVGEAGLAFVVPAAGTEIDEEALRAWCKEKMAGYKVPRHVRFVEELPLNATGKVDKLKLREIARAIAAG